MSIWLFSSSSIENIRVAKQRLLWGFWDREAGEKMRKNWRSFIRLYNKIEPFDIVIFQIAKTGDIYALGIVKSTYYDDQTPVWSNEREKNIVLYPWRVEFSIIIFSEKPLTKRFIKVQNYIDGYGIGEVPEHEFRNILKELNKMLINSSVNVEIFGG